ncbi:hypothetical protein [uncultured Chloroflexus sp.]|nr:hypothetical protein [uncultured Chloroflexus sp.]
MSANRKVADDGRVGEQFAAHTIGIQMAATEIGTALIPVGMGVVG